MAEGREKHRHICNDCSFGYVATVREFAFQDGEYSLKIPTIYPIGGKTYEEALSDGVRASIKMLQDKQKENSHE